MKKIYTISIGILVIIIGILISIYSGYDDSPGGVVLGVVIVSVSLITMYFKFKQSKE